MRTEDYKLTVGTDIGKRTLYETHSFNSFQMVVEFLRNSRVEIEATTINKRKSSWISSEVCQDNEEFHQGFFQENGKTIPLDFDGKLHLKGAVKILQDNKLNYYIYNSTNNGKNGKHNFRMLLPLTKKLTTNEETTDFYKSLAMLFENKADTGALHSCRVMYSPQYWISSSKRKTQEVNNNVVEIDKMNFNGLDVDVDNIKERFPIKAPTYSNDYSEDIDKVDTDKQAKAVAKAKAKFLFIPPRQGLRNKGFFVLARELRSYGYNDIEINQVLLELNYKKNSKNVEDLMKKVTEIPLNLTPSILKTEYYIEEVIDSKIKAFNTQDANAIMLPPKQYLSDLVEFQSKELFKELSVNLLSSPTGTGKTSYVLSEYIKYIEEDEYIVLVVPYLTLFNELKNSKDTNGHNKYNLYAISGNERFDIDKANEFKIILTTYDKYVSLAHPLNDLEMDKCHIFLDEAHNLYTSHSYRYKALNGLYNLYINHQAFKKLILMSGTFDTSYFPSDFIDNSVIVNRENSLQHKECYIVSTTKKTIESASDKAIEIYKEDNTRQQIIYLNNKDLTEDIAKKIETEFKIKTLQLNAKTTKNKAFKDIYEENRIPKDVKILFVTKIGEEGISFNNEIYAIHTVGKVDATVAEQLGNRPRKNATKLFIHTSKKDNSSENIYNTPYKDLSAEYKKKFESINDYVKKKKIHYKHKSQEEFRKFTIWDEYSNIVTLIDLKISADLYQDDRNNELKYYDKYFTNKMKYYGWDVHKISDKSLSVIQSEYKHQSIGIKSHNFLKIIEGIKKYMLIKKDILKIADAPNFIEYMRNSNLNEDFLKATFIDYIVLSNHWSPKDIIKAYDYSNKTTNYVERLFLVSRRARVNDSRIDRWVYDNVKVDSVLNKNDLADLAKRYIEEKNKFTPNSKSNETMTTQAINKILANYFLTSKVNEKVGGKTQQTTHIGSVYKAYVQDEIEIPSQNEYMNVCKNMEILINDNPSSEQNSTKFLSEYEDMLYNIGGGNYEVLEKSGLSNWM